MSEHPTITAIKPLPSDPERVSVRVGRNTVAKIPREAVDRIGLIVGERWTEALASRVEEFAGVDKAKRDALRLINRRDLSTGEMADRLARKGHDRELAKRIAGELADRGLIDDESYGRSVIRTELARKPAGRRLLEQKLYQKKIPRDLIAVLLREHEADDERDDVAAARELAAKKLAAPSTQRLDPQKRRQRIWSLLARRGFDPGTINAALGGLADELGGGDAPTY